MKRLLYEVRQGCTLCGMCIYECPTDAIKITPDGAKINPEKCIGCGNCANNCASEAIIKITK